MVVAFKHKIVSILDFKAENIFFVHTQNGNTH
jgi:hypothetical protein